jgi:hypothetical protein
LKSEELICTSVAAAQDLRASILVGLTTALKITFFHIHLIKPRLLHNQFGVNKLTGRWKATSQMMKNCSSHWGHQYGYTAITLVLGQLQSVI